MELYHKYRPKKIEDVVGQTAIVDSISKKLDAKKLPHVLLLSGSSGTGKTTLARIIKKELGISSDFNYVELNAANERGIETIRSVKQRVMQKATNGKAKLFVFDEAHKLTNDAQNSLLKLLEDYPESCYFILMTTERSKLIKAIVTRCTEYAFLPLSTVDLSKLVVRVAKAENLTIKEKYISKICEAADGSARKALVILEQVKDSANIEEAIAASDIDSKTIDLCRLLMNPKFDWKACAVILRSLTDEPENTRRAILGYFRSVLLSKGDGHSCKVIQAFEGNYFDEGASGLVRDCYLLRYSE